MGPLKYDRNESLITLIMIKLNGIYSNNAYMMSSQNI